MMKIVTERYLVLAIILVISGCSTQVPYTAHPESNSASTPGLIADLTIQSVIEKGLQDIQYAKYLMVPLVEPFKSYRHVLLLNLNTQILKVGLADENSNQITWFELASEQLEQCLQHYSMTFGSFYVREASLGDIEIQISALPKDGVKFCAGRSDLEGTSVLKINHSVYVTQVQSSVQVSEMHKSELDSLMVSVFGTDLMLHLDDFVAPSIAITHQYLDERQLSASAVSDPKRLRSEFRLKEIDVDPDVFFEKTHSLSPEIIPDPIQKNCTTVHVSRSDEQIYISFKQFSDHRRTLLSDLCGIYFERTRRLYRVESHLGSSVEL